MTLMLIIGILLASTVYSQTKTILSSVPLDACTTDILSVDTMFAACGVVSSSPNIPEATVSKCICGSPDNAAVVPKLVAHCPSNQVILQGTPSLINSTALQSLCSQYKSDALGAYGTFGFVVGIVVLVFMV
ncbi:hypothetical protein HDU79_003425 [Rhizoclosmatium sp. JEL0117]|nr:hypothetical protein HDU79_003425 [Rhizoclosmatium sp. JEL0117]